MEEWFEVRAGFTAYEGSITVGCFAYGAISGRMRLSLRSGLQGNRCPNPRATFNGGQGIGRDCDAFF
jgi:hypothetical protein